MPTENDTVRKYVQYLGLFNAITSLKKADCCGKTSLLHAALSGSFHQMTVPFEQVPETYECYVAGNNGLSTIVRLNL
ncbi:hypothetical protein FOBRF1_016747 [Fusarium oxysporum]